MEHRVYVPAPGHPAVADIIAGSGIVASEREGRLLADYEGNRNGAANIVTLADRVHHAADRQAAAYPTVARRLVPAEALVAVGWYDDERGAIVPDDPEAEAAIAAWLGVDVLDPAELASTSMRHRARAGIMAALASPDPGVRQMARIEARRLGIDLDR